MEKILPLNNQQLENIKNFKYSATNESIVYNYIVSPFLNKILDLGLVPEWIAPNLLTLISLIFNIIGFLFVIFEAGNDFSYKLSRLTTLVITITHYLYIFFDNLDGKQARKTKTSSSFGMLLDHGCDVFTNICVFFNVAHLVRLGNESIFVEFLIITLYLGFFTTTYEEYVLGEMHLGIINGPDEGNFFIATGTLASVFLGNDFWIIKIKLINMTIGEFLVFINLIASFTTATIPFFYHVYQKKGIQKILDSLLDFIIFCNIILFPGICLYLYKEYYSANLSLIIAFTSTLYSKIIINLQLCICTGDKNSNFLDVILSSILILINYVFKNEMLLILSCSISMIIVGSNLIKLIYIRSNEILNYLNIRFLVIPYDKEKTMKIED
jgi:ethanolaminephosphotransferase